MSRTENLTRALLDALLLQPEKDGGLYLATGRPPLQRQAAGLTPLAGWEALADDVLRALLAALLGEALWAQFERQHELELALTLEGGAALSGSVVEHEGGLSATLRVARPAARTRSLSELGAPPVLTDLCAARAGLVVLSGPSGAGKSTTLWGMIDTINSTEPHLAGGPQSAGGSCHHVLVLGEDPPPALAPRRPVLTYRELTGAAAVDGALRAALRQGADVLVVDPLPDLALLPRLCELAGAGVLVLVSLRAGSSGQALTQLVSGFPFEGAARSALQAALRGLVHQRLCRGSSGGWHPAFEVVLDGPGMLSALREPEALSSYLTVGRRRGMQSLSEGLRRLVLAGLISEEELQRHATERRRFHAPSLQEL